MAFDFGAAWAVLECGFQGRPRDTDERNFMKPGLHERYPKFACKSLTIDLQPTENASEPCRQLKCDRW